MRLPAPAVDPPIVELLIVGGDVITMDADRRIILDGAIAIGAGDIIEVGTATQVRAAHPDVAELDASGCIVTPGMVNTHQHVTGDPLARSCVPDDLTPGASIFSWAVPLNDAHAPADDELAATLTFVDSALSGVTTVIEAGTIGHLQPVVDAADRVGIRAGLGVWGWDIEQGPFSAPTFTVLERQAATLDLLPARATSRENRLRGWITLVGHDLASDGLLVGAAALARAKGAQMTMHISPTGDDGEAYLKRVGVRPLVHFQRLGILGPHLLLAHAVWLDDTETDLICASRTAVAACPWAYAHHGQGAAANSRHIWMHRHGVAVGLGCDSPNANDGVDILDAARLAVGSAKDAAIDPTCCSAYDGLEMATIGGAAAAGMDYVGAIRCGMAADIVIHDATRWQWRPRGNPVQQLVWSAQGHTVRDVLIDGQIVVRHGRCLTVDEDELRVAAASHQAAVLARAGLSIPQRWPVLDGRSPAPSSVGGRR